MPEPQESFVPQILVDYYQNRRTGILTLKQSSTRKTIHFENGNIVFATSNLESEQLGACLIEWGLLTQQQLMQVNKLAEENRRFGKSLLELNYIQSEDLPKLFYRQIIKIISATFDWQVFECRFTRCALPEYEVKNLISVTQALLEGFREITDILLIKQMFEDFYTPLKLTVPLTDIYQNISLTSQEAFLLSNIENATFRVDELVKIGSLSEDVVVRTISALRLAGFLEISRESVTDYSPMLETSDLLLKNPEVQPTVSSNLSNLSNQLKPEIDRPSNQATPSSSAHSNRISLPQVTPLSPSSTYSGNPINSSPVNYSSSESTSDTHSAMEFCREIENKITSINSMVSLYEVLEVNASATKEQIVAAYERLSKHFDPNRQHELTPYKLNLANELNYISTTIKQAYEVLSSQLPNTKATSNVSPKVASTNKTTPSNIPALSNTNSTPATKPVNQQEIMEFCYLVETKLNLIKSENTHYQVLELDRNATNEMIDQACSKLTEQFNVKKQETLSPYGINLTTQLTEITNAIKLATEVLSNPQKRVIYDEQLGRGLKRNTSQYSTISTPSEVKNTPSGKYSENKYSTPPPRPVQNPAPPLTNDANLRKSLPSNPVALPNASNLTSQPIQVLPFTSPNRSSAGTKLPNMATNAALPTSSNNSLPNTNQPSASNNPMRSNPSTTQHPGTNSTDPNRSSAGKQPSIVIDPSRGALPTLTPLTASRAQSVTPAQPAQPPAGKNTPSSLSKPTLPSSELPPVHKNIPGGKGKTFTATEYYLKSIELCDQKKYVEAVEMLMFALKISPKDGEYWAQLARAYNNISGYEKDSEYAYKKAIECAPKDVNYFFELGNLYRNQGLTQKAAEMYQEVLKINPNSARARNNLAELAKEETSENAKPKGFWSKLLGQE